MMKYLLILSIVFSLCSCDSENRKNSQNNEIFNQDTTTASGSTGSIPTNNSDWSGCYDLNIEKDSAFMKLSKTAGGYGGSLQYKRFEKDSNDGTVSLIEDSKYLKGWYRFQSEGKNTVREIYFRKAGTSLEEGYGEITMLGDTVLYKYPATLDFESKHPFLKANCK
jgi:hypothetical protein